jgi:hypothetical protein
MRGMFMIGTLRPLSKIGRGESVLSVNLSVAILFSGCDMCRIGGGVSVPDANHGPNSTRVITRVSLQRTHSSSTAVTV